MRLLLMLAALMTFSVSCERFEIFDKDDCGCYEEHWEDECFEDEWDDCDCYEGEWEEEEEWDGCGCDDDEKDWDKEDWDKDFWDKDKYEYEKVVLEELEYGKCECPVSGVIEYLKEDVTVAIVDYGDGECDNVAVPKQYVLMATAITKKLEVQ